MPIFKNIFGNFFEAPERNEENKELQEFDKVESISTETGPIITIAREFGSGGREIALKVAEKLNYKFYDKEEIVKNARENGIDTELFEQLNEKSMDSFWFKLSPLAYDMPKDADSYEQKVSNDKMFMIQSDVIRNIAKKGNAVFVGRCASYILKNSAKKVFITASLEDRVQRIEKRYKLDKNDAIALIKSADQKREKYYDYYTNTRWNAPENYDLVIDVSETGIDGAVDKIVELMKEDN